MNSHVDNALQLMTLLGGNWVPNSHSILWQVISVFSGKSSVSLTPYMHPAIPLSSPKEAQLGRNQGSLGSFRHYAPGMGSFDALHVLLGL